MKIAASEQPDLRALSLVNLPCLDAFRTFCCSEEARLGAERATQLLAA